MALCTNCLGVCVSPTMYSVQCTFLSGLSYVILSVEECFSQSQFQKSEKVLSPQCYNLLHW